MTHRTTHEPCDQCGRPAARVRRHESGGEVWFRCDPSCEPRKPKKAEVVDLMAALKKSLMSCEPSQEGR